MSDNSALVPYGNTVGNILNNTPQPVSRIVDAARSVACPLYRDYPSFMTGEWANNPLSGYNDGLLSEFCAPDNIQPQPPTPPFTGGQCVNTEYLITYTYQTKEGLTGTSSGDFEGSIISVAVEDFSTGSEGQQFVGIAVTYRGGRGTPPRKDFDIAPANPGLKITSLTVVPLNGGADNCGDPPPRYPITRPPAIALNPTVNFDISPNVNINAPVSIFAPIRILAPSIRLGDFNLDFNLGGINVTVAPEINPPTGSPNGDPPQQPAPGNRPVDRDDSELLKKIQRYLDRLRECQDCDEDFNFANSGVVSGEAVELTVPSNSILLTAGVELINQPSNKKAQPGRGQPDVIFAGWGWFEGNGYLGDRQPVDAQKKLFYAPQNPSVQKFRATVSPGFSMQVIIAYKSRKSPLPPI